MFEVTANDHEYYGFGVNAGAVRYQVATSTANHIFYTASSPTTSTELLRIRGSGGLTTPYAASAIQVGSGSNFAQISTSGTGSARYHAYNGGAVVEWLFGQDSATSHDFTFSTAVSTTITPRVTITRTGNLIATARWGSGYISGSQTIPGNGSAAILWASSLTGPLTFSSSNRFTNSTGITLTVQISFIGAWQQQFSIFSSVAITVKKNGTAYYGLTNSIADGNVTVSTAATTILSLADTDYFEIWAIVSGGVDRVLLGGTENSAASITQFTYSILN